MSAIEASLELAAERGGDITALVYDRLFAAHPDMEALFIRDTDGAVRGQMLSQVIDTLLDLDGRGAFARNMIGAEIVNHENLGVPPDVFRIFFGVVRDSVREVCADGWTAEMDTAWTGLLANLDAMLAPAA